MNKSQAKNGDPFAELLDSAAGSRPREEARLDRSKREQPTAPVSRAKVRADALAREEPPNGVDAKSEDPVKNEAPAADESVEAEQLGGATATKEMSENPTDTPDKQDSEQTDATVEPIAVADAGPTETPETELTSPAATESSPVSAEDDAAPAIVPATDGADAPLAETATAAPAANAGAAADAGAAPVNAALQPATAPQAPAPAPADDAAQAAPIVPGNSSGAAPAADQAQAPQPAPANPNAAAFGDAMEAFTGDADQQSAQQQNGSAPVQAKPQEAAVGRPVEASNAPTAPADPSAPKIQPNLVPPAAMPEPVRALNASFDPASLSAANTNESKPVPLSGPAIAVEIVSRMREGMRRFDIRLDPPELGRIDVRLEVDRNGNVSTKLTVDRPETLELVQRESRGLERALQQAGLKTDAGGLEFSLRQQADERFGHGHSGRGDLYAEPAGHNSNETVETVIQGYRSAAFARGGVDIRV